jgi:PKD repeat protein
VPGGAGQTFSPSFSTAGAYTVTVVVNNALGSSTIPTPLTLAQPICASNPTDTNTAIGIVGRTSGCFGLGTVCSVGETIQFSAVPYGWTSASCDTYLWSFGDGTPPSTDKSATHVYSSNGAYTITLKLTGGLSTANLSTRVNIGIGSQPQPTPTPTPNPVPTPGSCPTLTTTNVYIGFFGNTSGCTPSFASCTSGEKVSFSAIYPYCGSATFSWAFGDGGIANDASPSHTYAAKGSYNVTLNFSNGASSIPVSQVVSVDGGGPAPNPNPAPNPGSCGTITKDNVYIGYYGPKSTCTPSYGQCSTDEDISFTVSPALINGYNFGCGSNSFSWDFGDKSQPGSGRVTSHKYAGGGTYTVTATIDNGSGPVPITQKVSVAGGSGQQPAPVGIIFDFTVTKLTSGGVAIPNGYVFTATSNPAGAVTTWNWDFGDGNRTTGGAGQTHIYGDAQNYRVTLTAVGADGQVSKLLSSANPRHRSGRH